MVGPNVGRIFAGLYPTTNFLLGYHTSAEDCCYDGTGFILPGHPGRRPRHRGECGA